ERPGIGNRKLVGRDAEARAESLAGRQPFEAVAVVRAATHEGVTAAIVRYAHVSELGVQQAVGDLAADDRPATDPGSDRHVTERLETARGAEVSFAEGGHADVGLDRDRPIELRGEQRANIRSGPAWFGRRRDRAEVRRALVEIERAERADSDRDGLGVQREERGNTVD